LIYRFVIFLFKKFKIIELIDKLDIEFEDDEDKEITKDISKDKKTKKKFSEVF